LSRHAACHPPLPIEACMAYMSLHFVNLDQENQYVA
jgi:hypothetical protein